MTVIVCGHAGILPTECVECGGWLHRERGGGYPAQIGQVCSEDCAAGQSTRLAARAVDVHLGVRDLLCDCPEVCAPRGLPTAEQRAEYAAYVEGLRQVLAPEAGGDR